MGLGWLSTDLSMALMPPIGIFLQRLGGYQSLFSVAAVVCSLGVGSALGVRSPKRRQNTVRQPMLPQGLLRRTWGPLLGIILHGVAFGTVLSFIPLLAEQNEIRNLGWFWSFFSVTQLATRVPVGKFSDRTGRRRVAVVGMLLLASTFGAWNLVRTEIFFFGLACLFGLATVGTRMLFDVLVIDHVLTLQQGRASAVAIACFDVGVGVGSFGVGIVISRAGANAGTLLVTGLCLLGTALFSAWRPSMEVASDREATL